MGLSQYNFLPIYSKDVNDLYSEFYKPCMENSLQYDRITGFFGSSIFAIITDSLKEFIKNDGKIRIICSQVISSEDCDAIVKGYKDKEKIEDAITEEIIKEIENLSTSSKKELEVLSTLIKYGVLDIKVSVFLGHGNNIASYSQLVHDKIGIFTDDKGAKVVFGGSMNETFSGISNQGNLESFSVYTNWDNEKDTRRVEIYSERFNNIWNRKSDSVLTYNFPDEALKIIKTYESNMDLIALINDYIDSNAANIQDRWYAEKGENRRRVRKHQKDALDDWEKKNRQGIFEMATGSGKTFTALCAIRDSVDKKEIPLIVVPSNILMSQWEKEVEKTFGDEEVSILVCGDNNNSWQKDGLLYKFTNPNLKTKRIVLATIQTASKDKFINLIYQSESLFLIVDEVHRSGSDSFSKIFGINSGPRMGLSATPKRFRDPIGTKKIYDYFKNEVYPKYDLFQAIKDGNLTPYDYEFKIVYLSNAEQNKWNKITAEINKKIAINLTNNSTKEVMPEDSYLQKLLIDRARIVKKAKDKTRVAIETIKEFYEDGQKWLVYCEDTEQLENVFQELRRNKIRSYIYISDMKSDKAETLNLFEKIGGVLVAIKCLDEGVDIPSVTHALILASSTNPREYIQRRGRILRKSPNKEKSVIIDCIVLPNTNVIDDINPGLSIIRSELARAYYFGRHALNKDLIDYELNKIIINNRISDFDFEGGIENE